MEPAQAQTASLAYFLKANLANPILVRGKAVAFEHIGNNWGVIALDPAKAEDKDAIAYMDGLAGRGVGGVSKISADQYAQKKSQPMSLPSGRPSSAIRQRPSGPPRRRVQPVAAVTRPVAAALAVKLESPPIPKVEPPLDLANLKAASEAPPPVAAFQPPTRRISRSKPAEKAPPA